MHPHLQAAYDEIDRHARPLAPDTIARPVPGRWSIAEILEHLTLAFGKNAEAMEKALVSGELRARAPGWGQAFARILVIDIGYFPRVEAPEATRPSGSIAPERSVRAALDALQTLDAALTRASSRFGDASRVANHPYFAGLTVPQWRKFHWRHTAHHMRQVRAAAR